MNLYTTLKGLLLVAGKKDIRAYLNGVHVTPTLAQATDGHVAVRVNGAFGELPSEGVVLEAHSLRSVLTRFKAKDKITLEYFDGVAKLGGYVVEVINQSYPDMARVFSLHKIEEKEGQGVAFNPLGQASKALSVIQATRHPCGTISLSSVGVRIKADGIDAILARRRV